jgi:F-type H+-transporting ATPase subunit a
MQKTGLIGVAIFHIGGFTLSGTVLTTWGIMLGLLSLSWFLTRRLDLIPGPLQTALEGALSVAEDTVRAVLPEQHTRVFPFVASLWLFILISNLIGVVPGISSPTADLSLTAALSILVFFSVHVYGIQSYGLKRYLRHYLTPNPILLPFHVISEITRTLALAFRLFGNMMSLEMAALLVLWMAGFLVPVPILMLHVVEAVVQAYIFGMLALIYIAGGIQSQQLKVQDERSGS